MIAPPIAQRVGRKETTAEENQAACACASASRCPLPLSGSVEESRIGGKGKKSLFLEPSRELRRAPRPRRMHPEHSNIANRRPDPYPSWSVWSRSFFVGAS